MKLNSLSITREEDTITPPAEIAAATVTLSGLPPTLTVRVESPGHRTLLGAGSVSAQGAGHRSQIGVGTRIEIGAGHRG